MAVPLYRPKMCDIVDSEDPGDFNLPVRIIVSSTQAEILKVKPKCREHLAVPSPYVERKSNHSLHQNKYTLTR